MANHTLLALGDYTDYKYHPFHDVAARLESILSEQGFAVKCTEDRRALQDELYMFEFVTAHHLRTTAECTFEGESCPVAWTQTPGKGRVAYLALGHSVESFQNEMFARLVANSALWSCFAL